MAAAQRDGRSLEAYSQAQAAAWVPARLLVDGVDRAAEICTSLPGTAGIMADLPGGSVSVSVQGELPDLALVRMNGRLSCIPWL